MSSKGAERFPRPLHTLSLISFPHHPSSVGVVLLHVLLVTVLGLVLGLPAEADPRHDVVVSETPPTKETCILHKCSSRWHSSVSNSSTFSSPSLHSLFFPLFFAYFPSFSSFLMFSSYLCTCICTRLPVSVLYLKRNTLGFSW